MAHCNISSSKSFLDLQKVNAEKNIITAEEAENNSIDRQINSEQKENEIEHKEIKFIISPETQRIQ